MYRYNTAVRSDGFLFFLRVVLSLFALAQDYCAGHLATVGRNCPDRRFVGTLNIGVMVAVLLLSDRGWWLIRADCTVTGGLRKVCAPTDEAADTPIMFSMLKEGLLLGSDLMIEAAVLRLFS